VFSIMGIYLLLNLVALYILPMKEIAGNTFVLGTVADRIFGTLGDPIIRSIMVISMLSCLNANQLFCSRTLHAMSCDGLFFRRAAKVNVGGTPTFSLLLSTIVGIIFVLGSFERVIAMLSFFFCGELYAHVYIAFRAPQEEPQMERPYRAWGYPWTTAIALIGSVLFSSGRLQPTGTTPLALGMLVLSYPVFRVMKWASRQRASRHAKRYCKPHRKSVTISNLSV
jgi:APA family basic amino acid/polyamine antiporter